MDFAHGTDHARLDPFLQHAGALIRMALIAHLGDNSRFNRGRLQHAGLADRMRERFLHIDVLAHLDRHERGREMRMVRRRNRDCINLITHFRQHLPVIAIAGDIGKLVENSPSAREVHVAQGNDVLAGRVHHIDLAPPP